MGSFVYLEGIRDYCLVLESDEDIDLSLNYFSSSKSSRKCLSSFFSTIFYLYFFSSLTNIINPFFVSWTLSRFYGLSFSFRIDRYFSLYDSFLAGAPLIAPISVIVFNLLRILFILNEETGFFMNYIPNLNILLSTSPAILIIMRNKITVKTIDFLLLVVKFVTLLHLSF